MRHIARHSHRFSYTDYLGWDDDTRWEIIDGEAYAMAPAPTTPHQLIVANIAPFLGNAFRGKPCRPLVAPTDVKLSDHDVVQPDLLVVCEQAKIGEAFVLGAPDLAIKVTSPSTEARDRREKRSLYERFGVPEYWLVSPSGFVEVYALDEGGRYPTPTIAGLDESLTSPTLSRAHPRGQRRVRRHPGRTAPQARAAGERIKGSIAYVVCTRAKGDRSVTRRMKTLSRCSKCSLG